MKSLYKVLFTAALLATGSLATAAVVAYSDGYAPAVDDSTWAGTNLPAPSSTDLVNGITATQIGTQTAHNGSAIDFAAFTDGASTVAYPGQLPADYPGVNTPTVAMFWAFGSPTNVSGVAAYCYNWNGGNGPDIRSVPVIDVYTTTDATPTAGGTWTKIADKARVNGDSLNVDWYSPEPVASPFGDSIATHGNCVLVYDDTGADIGTAITGIRVDFYSAGFGSELRNPENTGVDGQAVSSPFIAEVDVLQFPASVNDWTMY